MPVLRLLGAAATAAVTVVTVGPAAVGSPAPERPSASGRHATAVPVAGNVTVTVPLVATSADDGLPRVLPVGAHQLDLPVWEAPNGPAERVEGAVSGAAGSCRGVPLVPGAVVRLRCELVVRAGQGRVVVTVRSRGVVVGRFTHVAAA